MKLSIVVPVYNEQDNVQPLYERLRQVLGPWQADWELIFVDDGSRDATFARLQAIHAASPRVRVIRFHKNFGQTAALSAGIRLARGEVIVTLDGDMQNDPRDIPRLVTKIQQGYDLVTGWRQRRQDPFLSRTLPSRVANWLIRRVTGVQVRDTGCSLKAYRSQWIKRLPLYADMHRFIPALAVMAGVRAAELAVGHFPRQRGQSKYGLSRIGKVLLDLVAVKMLASFARRPMHWFSAMAAPFSVASLVLGGLYVTVLSIGRQSAIVWAISCLLASYVTIHFLILGLLAELIIRKRFPRVTVPGGSAKRGGRRHG